MMLRKNNTRCCHNSSYNIPRFDPKQEHYSHPSLVGACWVMTSPRLRTVPFWIPVHKRIFINFCIVQMFLLLFTFSVLLLESRDQPVVGWNIETVPENSVKTGKYMHKTEEHKNSQTFYRFLLRFG